MKRFLFAALGVFLFSITVFASIASDQEGFIKVAEKVMPTVVNINTERTIKQTYQDPFEELFNDPFFGREFNRRTPNKPKETKRKATSLGSGFVISKDGYVITNNHVIDKADKIEVTFSDKSTYKAKLIGTDADTDIALLKIDAKKDLPFVEIGDSDSLKIGQWAIAIGNPFGLNNTMTVGIISAKGRSGMGIENYENFIQTDASINPGNSGGPLVDIEGKVIGINTAILSQTGGNMGIGFAIPINMAHKITKSLKDKGKVERGWLGVSIQPLESEMAKKFGLDKAEGALIGEVLKGSPSEKAGLKRGDIVLSVDDKTVKDYNELRNLIANTPPDSKVKLNILRNGKKLDIYVTLGKKNDADLIAKGEKSIMGLKLKDLDAELAKKFGYDKDMKGVFVSEVENDSYAESLGIKPGDLILELNKDDINSVKEFIDKYNKINVGEQFLLYISGNNSNRYLLLEKQDESETKTEK